VLADVDMQWGPGRDEVMIFFSPEGLVVVAPSGRERFRIVATYENPGSSRCHGHPDAAGSTRADIERRARVSNVVWSSRFASIIAWPIVIENGRPADRG
jgi:hypothetical protein